MKQSTIDKVIQMYLDENPSAETSIEIVQDISEQLGESANAVRMELIKANVYVKRVVDKPEASESTGTKSKAGTGTKRVSKEDSLNALKAAITSAGGDLDEEILSKLTGKVAIYFTNILNNTKGE